MKQKTTRLPVLAAALLGAVLAALPVHAQPACVTFEPPLALGATYGSPVGQLPGALAFVSNGIPVRVDNFQLSTGPLMFNRAYIDNAPFPFGAGQSIRTNNINLVFDFSKLSFKVSRVRFSYLDLGGYENLAVNASPLHVGELTAAPPVLAGVTVSVSSSPLPPPFGGKTGTVVLKGPVKSLKIGGQELWIDQVCAD